MCGIVGAIARRNVVPILIEGLKRLEYRGYDSAGIAVVNGKLHRVRSTGRVAQLGRLVTEQSLAGTIGIAHTRWATHGAPSEANAHPHVSGGISVVHNGIIENHEAMRAKLRARGYVFHSETDSEVIAHLVHSFRRDGNGLLAAVRKSVAQLRGAYAIAVIAEEDPTRMVVARMGAPLLLGLGENEYYAASDSSALLPVTQKMIFLEEGDCAEVSLAGVRIVEARGRRIERPMHQSSLSAEAVELGAYQHYMQKEIFEQPRAIADTLELAVKSATLSAHLFGTDAPKVLDDVRSVLVLACGTSYHAGLVARHWIESLAGIPCNVEIASEYRYRDSVPDPHALVVAISQSGETADTLAALEHARTLGQPHSLAICNVAESALVRTAKLRFLTRAGPEIGVASTKAFTTQLASLLLLAMTIAKRRGKLSVGREAELLEALRGLPSVLTRALETEGAVTDWSVQFSLRRHALFLGRGIHHPIAMEGALKLKEISYIHAEAYPAGELKHGPLALVDATMPVIAIAPRGTLLEKLKSNLQEVRARGGELFVMADEDARMSSGEALHVIQMPPHPAIVSPIVHAVPLQLLAYHAALCKGTDVDKPRNLAKSVTVE
ncbi:MAG TPA: glutamine--fructose-6-phosphate transaminase (isomerizing) [Usitatibacter sp.]|jgi:glucosamine--fructose-6-phosphate aminotransferase (isomerizing)|nr:glutamine--fructose-6-phosphate transaminase (isomerizing) [Usitatibacter sp.]